MEESICSRRRGGAPPAFKQRSLVLPPRPLEGQDSPLRHAPQQDMSFFSLKGYARDSLAGPLPQHLTEADSPFQHHEK